MVTKMCMGLYHASRVNVHKQILNFFFVQNENGVFIPWSNETLQIMYHSDMDVHNVIGMDELKRLCSHGDSQSRIEIENWLQGQF